MSYATPARLLLHADTMELHQRLLQNHAALTEAALVSAIGSEDMSGYPAEVQEAAGEALARLETLLESASGVIDSYVSGRYVTPLNPVPAGVDKHCCNIALYDLYGTTAREGDPVQTRWAATIRWLEKVASGAIPLGADALGDAPAMDSGLAQVQSAGSAFDGGVAW